MPEAVVPDEEKHGNTSRYYPVTIKDHGEAYVKHNYCEHENEGMDTHTTSSRYYPVVGTKKTTKAPVRAKERGVVLTTTEETEKENTTKRNFLNVAGLLRAKEKGAVLPVVEKPSAKTTVEQKTGEPVEPPQRAKERGATL